MKFLDFLKKFLIFSLKEIYSFFLKMSLFIFVIFIIGISAIAIFSSKDKNEKMKKSYEYILFNVSDVTEDKIVGSNFLSDEKLSYMDILNSLDDIKNNNQVKGVVIALDTINLSSAKIEELIKKFEELKANNKKVYAFGAYITNSNYKLASVADEVVMVPSASASLDLTGYHYLKYFYQFYDSWKYQSQISHIYFPRF